MCVCVCVCVCVFSNHHACAGCDARTVFKWCVSGWNLELSF